MKTKEMELLVKTHDGTDIKTFIARPDDDRPHPGVLVIMEIWGVTDFIRTVCRRLAEHGYVALAPHLYSRKEQFDLFTEENIMDAMRPFWALPPEKRGDQETVREVLSRASENSRKIVNEVMFNRQKLEENMIKDLEYAYSYLFKECNTTRKGVVGFCLGGGLAFQLSTQVEFDASVIFYGANPRKIDDLERIRGAVMGLYAGEDGSINAGLPDLLKNVVKHKVNFEMKIYPGTFHAFFNHTGMSYNEPASRDAWKMLYRFYAENLGGLNGGN
ncbi:MAG: dienelactone hydrolase family protein [Candidatus Thermoplasmatota archaeon]|nr:dienelactone hydrolase family protein [Candidatus Thermoplasmatota archaeon]